ncbi:MAG: gamma-glutamylcyclotransferase family protein [Rubripirellula sp.]
MITRVFVYGTLKRGQCRDGLWPCVPRSVNATWTRGTLYGRSDYPAMIPGQDRVTGECWSFSAEDMVAVMQTLDRIEGANQPGQPDLYHRVEVDVWDLEIPDESAAGSESPPQRAVAYHYVNDPGLHGFRKIKPSRPDACVGWSESICD